MAERKSVSMQDLADKLGISKVTVSKALNGKDGVGEELKEKIFALARESGYVLPDYGKRKSKKVGIIMSPRFSSGDEGKFYMAMYERIIYELQRASCSSIMISPTTATLPSDMNTIQTRGLFDGLIFLGILDKGVREQIAQIDLPKVYVDIYDRTHKSDSVITENIYSSYELTNYLIQQGHTDIGFVGTVGSTTSISDRYLGYLRRMLEEGISPKNEWRIPDRSEEGIAIPHAKTSAVKAPGLAAMLVKDGVDFNSLDGEPAKLFFLIAAPDTKDNVHLDVLSHLSMLLMNDNFRSELLNAGSAKDFLAVIDKYENEKFEDEEEEAPAAEPAKQRKVLAVTACPTGIAHTYMAAEALQEMAGKMGVAMKVETNGSGGVKNKLTAAEIEEAEGIIVAADKNVPVERFAGKPVIFVKVADGINKPKELIEEILSGNVSAYAGKGAARRQVTWQMLRKVWGDKFISI